jgi:hypothetical protein
MPYVSDNIVVCLSQCPAVEGEGFARLPEKVFWQRSSQSTKKYFSQLLDCHEHNMVENAAVQCVNEALCNVCVGGRILICQSLDACSLG